MGRRSERSKPKSRRKRGSAAARSASTAARGVAAQVEELVRACKAAGLLPHGLESAEFTIHDRHRRIEVRLAGGARAAVILSNRDLRIGERVPDCPQREAVGAATSVIKRGTPEFDALEENRNTNIEFKDEEGTGADRLMISRLRNRLDALAVLVKNEWSGYMLRVTEAWDENMEHGTNSVHYEARAADLTTWPVDATKLGRLARLAVDAGFQWVFYENALHVHVSMAKDP